MFEKKIGYRAKRKSRRQQHLCRVHTNTKTTQNGLINRMKNKLNENKIAKTIQQYHTHTNTCIHVSFRRNIVDSLWESFSEIVLRINLVHCRILSISFMHLHGQHQHLRVDSIGINDTNQREKLWELRNEENFNQTTMIINKPNKPTGSWAFLPPYSSVVRLSADTIVANQARMHTQIHCSLAVGLRRHMWLHLKCFRSKWI